MKTKAGITLLLALFCCLSGWARSSVRESLTFHSEKLGKEASYSIYLPDGYETSGRNYPVLYLLHGYTDDETMWLQAGQVQAIADQAIAGGQAAPMIIVMPNAWDTFYVNQYDGKFPYEDMFFEELIPYMEKTYRIRPRKEYRAIAGLSMGGYGSLLYSLHHPELFAACCPLSAAVFGDEVMKKRQAESHKDLFGRLFGPGLDYWHRNSPLEILSQLPEGQLPRVRYYIDCGDDDALFDGNAELHRIMREKGIPHEFRVRDGGHTWTYWRTALPEVLRFISQSFLRS